MYKLINEKVTNKEKEVLNIFFTMITTIRQQNKLREKYDKERSYINGKV